MLPDGLSQEEFTEQIKTALNGHTLYLMHDENKKFRTEYGPVALIGVLSDGFTIEPAVSIFKWASKRNILRGFVCFFQWVKNSREVGACEIKVPSSDSKILLKMKDYGVLYPNRTDIVFRIKGKKRGRSEQTTG